VSDRSWRRIAAPIPLPEPGTTRPGRCPTTGNHTGHWPPPSAESLRFPPAGVVTGDLVSDAGTVPVRVLCGQAAGRWASGGPPRESALISLGEGEYASAARAGRVRRAECECQARQQLIGWRLAAASLRRSFGQLANGFAASTPLSTARSSQVAWLVSQRHGRAVTLSTVRKGGFAHHRPSSSPVPACRCAARS
jgi:hypothetical protein